MTIDEEIENLKYDIEGNLADLDFEFAENNRQRIAWLEELKELREKQIPKKAFETYDDDTCLYKHFECPSCFDRLNRHAENTYCMKCGQLIDWEEVEE